MKTVLTVAAVILATAAAVSGWTAYLVRPATVHTVTRTRTVTVTVTKAPKPQRKVRIRTVQTAPTIPCQDAGGELEPGVVTAGLPGDSTCSVTLLSPMGANHLAQIQLTAPNGMTSTWNLANPYG
jgi:hypothetical protein